MFPFFSDLKACRLYLNGLTASKTSWQCHCHPIVHICVLFHALFVFNVNEVFQSRWNNLHSVHARMHHFNSQNSVWHHCEFSRTERKRKGMMCKGGWRQGIRIFVPTSDLMHQQMSEHASNVYSGCSMSSMLATNHRRTTLNLLICSCSCCIITFASKCIW